MAWANYVAFMFALTWPDESFRNTTIRQAYAQTFKPKTPA